MAKRSVGELSLPGWLVGPGLVVPPVFLALLVCVWPRPVEPRLPLVWLEAREASRFLEQVSHRIERHLESQPERELVASWQSVRQQAARRERPGQELAQLQRAHLQSCHRVLAAAGPAGIAVAGEQVSWRLAAAASRVQLRPRVAEREAWAWGGDFLRHLRRAGLLARDGRLRVHPLVVYALARLGWHQSCGQDIEAELTPIELDAVDVFRIQYARALPWELRLRSVERFGERHPDYPLVAARTAILLAAGEGERAMAGLQSASREAPGDRRLRNFLLFVHRLWQ